MFVQTQNVAYLVRRLLLVSHARKLSSVKGGAHLLEIIRLLRKGLVNLVDTTSSTNLDCLPNYDVYLCKLLFSPLQFILYSKR